MVALEILINGERVCLAGASGVTWCTTHWGRFRVSDGEIKVRVGGREYRQPRGGQFYEWLDQTLKLGDEVTVRFIEAESVDPGTPVDYSSRFDRRPSYPNDSREDLGR